MRGDYAGCRAFIPAVALGASVAMLADGCGRGSPPGGAGTETEHRAPPPAEALEPAFFAAALRKIGGAHYHATAKFVVGAAPGSENAVTTTTDVWVDRAGNYRIREDNDRDGGREVVLYGRELAVALRYGRMIRRVAEEPEPSRLLEEALGAPWTAFELVAPQARLGQAGTELVGGARASVIDLALGGGDDHQTAATAMKRSSAGSGAFAGMRAWRKTAALRTLAGRLVLDDATGALVKADISATFSAKSNAPIQGAIEVHAVLSDIANTPAVERPAAEELVLRQRTLPEQRDLLRGLPSTPTTPPPQVSPHAAGQQRKR